MVQGRRISGACAQEKLSLLDKTKYVIETLTSSYKVRDVDGNVIGYFYKGERAGKRLYKFERTDGTVLGWIDWRKRGENLAGWYEVYDARNTLRGTIEMPETPKSMRGKRFWLGVILACMPFFCRRGVPLPSPNPVYDSSDNGHPYNIQSSIQRIAKRSFH